MNWDVRFVNFAQRFNIDPCAAERQLEVPCSRILSVAPEGRGDGGHKGKGLRGLLVHQQSLLAVCADGTLQVYDLREERWLPPRALGAAKMKLVKGHLLVVGGSRVHLLGRRHDVERTFVGHTANVTTAAIQERSLYTSCMDHRAREFPLGDPSAERMVVLAGLPVAIPSASVEVESTRVFEGHDGPVSCVAATEGLLFTSSSDKTVRVWDRSCGDLLHVLRGHVGWVLQLLFVDGILYSASNDGTVRAWNVQSGSCLRMFACPSSYPHMVHVQDGLLLAAADCRVSCWKTGSSKILNVFEGHELKVRSFIVEGKLLLTASSDLTVRVWDVQTATCLAVLRGHFEPVNGLVLHGHFLFSSSDDGTVRQWDLYALESKLAPVGAGAAYLSEDELEDEDIDAFVDFMRREALNKLETVQCPGGADLHGAPTSQRVEHKYWQRVSERVGAKEPLFKEGILMQRTSPVRFARRWVTLHYPALYVYAAADDELPVRVFDVPAGATVKLSSTNPLIWAVAGAGAQLEFVCASAEVAQEWVEVLSRVAELVNEEARYSGASATVRFDMTAVNAAAPILEQFPAAPAATTAQDLPDLPTSPRSLAAALAESEAETEAEAEGQPAIGITREDGSTSKEEAADGGRGKGRRGGMRLGARQRLSDLFPREFIEKEAAARGEEAVELQLRRDARRLSQLILKTHLQSLVTGVEETKKRASHQLLSAYAAEAAAETATEVQEQEAAGPSSLEEQATLAVPQRSGSGRMAEQKRRSQRLVELIAHKRRSATPVQAPEGTEAHDPEAVKVMLLWIRYKRVRRFKRMLEAEHAREAAEARAAAQAERQRSREEEAQGSFTASPPPMPRSRSVHNLKRSSGALAFRRGRFQEARGGSHLAFRTHRQEEEEARTQAEGGGEGAGREADQAVARRLARKLKVGTWSPAPSLRSKVRTSSLATMIQRSTATITSAEARMSGVLQRTRERLGGCEEAARARSSDSEDDEEDGGRRVHMPYYHEDILARPLPHVPPAEEEGESD